MALTAAALSLAVGGVLAGQWWASDASLQHSFETALAGQSSNASNKASQRRKATATAAVETPVAGTESYWLGQVDFGGGTAPAAYDKDALDVGDVIRWGTGAKVATYTVLDVTPRSLRLNGVNQSVYAVTCRRTADANARPETIVIDAAMAPTLRVDQHRPHAL